MASHYNVTAAKQAFLDHMADVAASQDLHQNQAPRVRRTAIAVTSLAGMFVVLRLLARLRQRVSFHTDDWLIVMSFWGLVANLAITLVLLHQGLGRHSGALTLAETQVLLKTLIGAELLYVYVLGLLKMSILFFYNRIFPVRDMKIGSRICGGVTLAWTLACTLAVLLQCRPMTKMWEPWLQGTCINTFVMQLVVSFLNILIDSSILLLPMPQIWKLHMKTSQKISLIAIFSVGSFAVFTSIFRFRVYWLYDGDDMSYTLAEACSWNIIEISSGVMSACLPSLGPLMQICFKSFYSSFHTENTAQTRIHMGTISGRNGQSNRSKQADTSVVPLDDDAIDIPPATAASSTRGGTASFKESNEFHHGGPHSSTDEIPLRSHGSTGQSW